MKPSKQHPKIQEESFSKEVAKQIQEKFYFYSNKIKEPDQKRPQSGKGI